MVTRPKALVSLSRPISSTMRIDRRDTNTAGVDEEKSRQQSINHHMPSFFNLLKVISFIFDDIVYSMFLDV